MDGGSFDDFVRRLSSGIPRRRVLKGLLGLGSATVISETSDARTLRTRNTVPPPSSPPTTTTTEASPPACDSGFEQCPDSEVCCPVGACARSGNQAVCCDGVSGYGSVVCGLECCADAFSCCDLECCAQGAVCLAHVYGPSVAEELCCPAEVACGGGCCDGSCYSPPDSGTAGFDRSCCPSGGMLCPGEGTYSGTAACCEISGATCCLDANGRPSCLTAGQCCHDSECEQLSDPSQCLTGVCRDSSCAAESACPVGSSCCLDAAEQCCPVGGSCCQRESETFCLEAGQCCDSQDCQQFENSYCDLTSNTCACDPYTCDDVGGSADCGTYSDGCGQTIDCGCDNGICCPGAEGSPGRCRTNATCCSSADCDEPPDACSLGVCSSPEGHCEYTSCQNGLSCCERTSSSGTVGVCIDRTQQCCDAFDCEDFGYHELCAECDSNFTCQSTNQDGECRDCGICMNGRCDPVPDDTACDHDEGICCQGYCTLDFGSCADCTARGSACEESDECCSGRCCDEVCVVGNCCNTDDCGDPCFACSDNFCVLTCDLENAADCCQSGQTCNEALNNGIGECVACGGANASCDSQSGPGCCDGLTCCGEEGSETCCPDFCVDNQCQSCLNEGSSGCWDINDCCTGTCYLGTCFCLGQSNGPCYEDDHCCAGLVCEDNGTLENRGVCQTTCRAEGSPCGPGIGVTCCIGNWCYSSDGGQTYACTPYEVEDE